MRDHALMIMVFSLFPQCSMHGDMQSRIGSETWSEAVQIAPHPLVDQDSELTRLAIDATGNAMAVWMHHAEGRSTIRSAHSRAGQRWGGQRAVLASRPAWVSDLQIATDTVVWREHDGAASGLYATRNTLENSWAAPTRIDQGVADVRLFRLASDGLDARVVAWVVAADYSRTIVVRTADAGDWRPSTRIDEDAGSIVGLDVGTARDGGTVVVWSRWVGTGYRILARRSEAGGWDAAGAIDDGLGDAIEPQVVVFPDGAAIVIWRQFDGTDYSLYANHYHRVGGWDVPVVIETHADNAVYPVLVGDARGDAVAVWVERRCETRRCTKSDAWFARFVAGRGWQQAVHLAPGVGDVQIAGDGRGRAIAVWAKNGAFGLPHIWSRRYDPDSGWDDPRPMKPNRRSSAHPTVAMNGHGEAVAVWEHFNLLSRRSLYASWTSWP